MVTELHCPICSGELTKGELQEASSPELDNQLCRRHLREQLKMIREAQ